MFKKILSRFKQEENNESENEMQDEIDHELNVNEIEEMELEKSNEEILEKEIMDNASMENSSRNGNEKISLFSKLKQGLSKTKQGIADKVDQVLKSYKKVDEDLFEEIEEILITSDVGVKTSLEIIERLRKGALERKITEAEDLKGLLKEILVNILDKGENQGLDINSSPAIILVVGVNGVGKTTSIGKIAHNLKLGGKKVLLAAGDTFRAAAIDQLEIWGKRVGVDVIKHQEGADPAAVIFDAIQSAKARKIDVLICDTAGRLHNKKNLMNELGKVMKVVDREFNEAAREIVLVLDATTGQNALQQAKIFKEVTDITGIVLTKLDGTAKGGVVMAISNELNIPVKLVGVGEGLNDLQTFNAEDFVNALFGDDK